jgi:hypothetical protein
MLMSWGTLSRLAEAERQLDGEPDPEDAAYEVENQGEEATGEVEVPVEG